jgi:competence protein ComEA
MDAKLSRVDINQATTKELIQLPGLGRKIAERIIAGRPYTSVDDLGHIQGVRNDLLEGITIPS